MNVPSVRFRHQSLVESLTRCCPPPQIHSSERNAGLEGPQCTSPRRTAEPGQGKNQARGRTGSGEEPGQGTDREA